MGDVEDRCTRLIERIRQLKAEGSHTTETIHAFCSAQDLIKQATHRRNRNLMLRDLDAAEQILAEVA